MTIRLFTMLLFKKVQYASVIKALLVSIHHHGNQQQ